MRLEPGALPHHQVTSTDGLCVTSVARTVCDCLRTLPLPDAVAVLDAAVGRGLVTAEEVVLVRRTQFRWPGATRIDRGLELHDPIRESWLESRAISDLWLLGIALPECQVSVLSARGEFLGRPEAIWRRHGVVLELDGPGQAAAPGDRLCRPRRDQPRPDGTPRGGRRPPPRPVPGDLLRSAPRNVAEGPESAVLAAASGTGGRGVGGGAGGQGVSQAAASSA